MFNFRVTTRVHLFKSQFLKPGHLKLQTQQTLAIVVSTLVTRTTARILLGHKLSKSRLKDFIFNHQFKCLKETLEPTLFNQNCHTDMEFMFLTFDLDYLFKIRQEGAKMVRLLQYCV